MNRWQVIPNIGYRDARCFIEEDFFPQPPTFLLGKKETALGVKLTHYFFRHRPSIRMWFVGATITGGEIVTEFGADPRVSKVAPSKSSPIFVDVHEMLIDISLRIGSERSIE